LQENDTKYVTLIGTAVDRSVFSLISAHLSILPLSICYVNDVL